MADFVQTMNDWRRMCRYYSDESMKDRQTSQTSCVDMCPLGHNTACGVMEDALDSDIEVMAKEIAKWASEHPEPVYPSWREWLEGIGALHETLVTDMDMATHAMGLANPIPADIAEKLGLKPKESV